MFPFRVLARSLCSKNINSCLPNGRQSWASLSFFTIPQQDVAATDSRPWRQHQFQSRRNLLLQAAPSETVKLEKLSGEDSGIIQLNLDRPRVKNAIGPDMLKALLHAFETVDKDSSARILMLCSSVPGVFCAGADLKERRKMTEDEVWSFSLTIRATFTALDDLRIPTIAVMEGAALGGGLELCLACDIRVCGEDAIMGFPETGHAIIPGAGGTARLPRLAGQAVAKDLIFTGRKITGKEALTLGIVNYCIPNDEVRSKALSVARILNQKGPIALRMAKKAISEGYDLDLRSSLELERDCYKGTLRTEDRIEGLNAFAEKRKPNYKGE